MDDATSASENRTEDNADNKRIGESSDGHSSNAHFSVQLKKVLTENNTDSAVALIHDEGNTANIVNECSECIVAVVEFLTNENFIQNPKLYNCCEDILKTIAAKANEDEVIMELLEVIDTTKNDNTVVSILKAMQLCLLKQREESVRSLEWCLNSIQLYVSDLQLSVEVRQRMESEEEKLLEEEEEVRRIISFYFYLFLFYEPILDHIVATSPATEDNFRLMGITRRNVLACFIIQLFNEPFACLDMSEPELQNDQNLQSNTNTYTRQCVQSLLKHFCTLFSDPLRLIGHGEQRVRWPYVLSDSDDTIMDTPPPTDIFHIEEKAPMTGLAVLYYVMITENVMPGSVPKVYRAIYLLEMGLYYVADLLKTIEDSLHIKGIRLAKKLLENLGSEELADDTLDLEVHTTFMTNLMNVLNTTQVRRNSKEGIELLKIYITKFASVEAKHYQIQRLLKTVDNNKICSYLVTIYKNVIADELNAADVRALRGELADISPYCSGVQLQTLLLEHICVIPNGVETDILQQNDLIIAALNMLRYLAIRDQNNRTQIWDYFEEIKKKFLDPLREALNCSRAQYRLEEKRINEKNSPELECEIMGADQFMDMSKENRLQVLTIGRNTFDLIDSLMSRLNECIELKLKNSEIQELGQ